MRTFVEYFILSEARDLSKNTSPYGSVEILQAILSFFCISSSEMPLVSG
jgi:hypothetical protein